MESSVGSSEPHEATPATPSKATVPHVHSATAAVEEQPAKKPRADTPSSPSAATAAPSSTTDAIPTSTTLLNARLRKQLKEIWAAARHPPSPTAPLPSSTPHDVATVIPPFKVGTLEMYRRFPQAYDLLMHHHNCSAVQTALLHDILGRIQDTASPPLVSASDCQQGQPWIRVADFGCGTGRIEEMAAQHSAVSAIYAYDSEVAMLKQCLVNTVRSAAQARHHRGVRLFPVPPTSPHDASSVVLCMDDEESSGEAKDRGERDGGAGAELELCVRPVPFQAVQDGFLATTHHPRCSVVVCAWSLSYVMRMQWGEDNWHAAVDAVVQALVDQLDTSASDAAVVILETLGNGSTEPTRQNTYTQRLEEHFNFTRTWVRTDYEFANTADAERMVRFFFGEKMLSKLTKDGEGEGCRLMECTGIWTLWKSKQC